jgi:hypothetical protein
MRATLRRMGAWSSMMRIFDLGMVVECVVLEMALSDKSRIPEDGES